MFGGSYGLTDTWTIDGETLSLVACRKYDIAISRTKNSMWHVSIVFTNSYFLNTEIYSN